MVKEYVVNEALNKYADAAIKYSAALKEYEDAIRQIKALVPHEKCEFRVEAKPIKAPFELRTFTTGQYAKKHGVKYQTAYARIQAAIKKGTIKKVVRGEFVKVKKG